APREDLRSTCIDVSGPAFDRVGANLREVAVVDRVRLCRAAVHLRQRALLRHLYKRRIGGEKAGWPDDCMTQATLLQQSRHLLVCAHVNKVRKVRRAKHRDVDKSWTSRCDSNLNQIVIQRDVDYR